jgi:hypothetical protein
VSRVSGRRAAALGAILLYALLALGAQRSLVPVLATHVYHQSILGNDCLLHAWSLAWDHHALATRPCRLLDANIFHPHEKTLLYSDHLLGLALPLWPLRLVTENALLVHNLATLAAPALSALAARALVLDLGGGAAAALVGGLVYGFAPVRFRADHCQLQMLAAWWLPLVLVFARRAVAGGRWRDAALAGAGLALQGLTGIYLTAFFAPFLALAHLHWLDRYPPPGHARGWRRLVAAEGAAALALVPFTLGYRAVQQGLGASRPAIVNGLLSLPLGGLPAFVPLGTLGVLLGAALVLRRRLPPGLAREARLHLAIALGGLAFALGPSVPLPGDLGAVAGPYRLLLALPGFDALRAPGRMVHVALLGAAVLAAGGLHALRAALRPPARAAALAAVLAALAVEAWPPVLATVRAPGRAEVAPLAAWLARQPEPVVLVELPIDDYAIAASTYQYTTIWHWRETLNGNMGILPPVYPWMVRELRRFPDEDVLADLRALDVTHVVFYGNRLPDLLRLRLHAMAAAPAPLVTLAFAEAGIEAWAIRPTLAPAPGVPRGRRLPRDGWRVEATHAAADAARAVDGDPTSAWSSWGDLERGLRAWWQPSPVPRTWQRFLDSLPVVLRVDLGRPERVTAVLLHLGGTDPLVPPTLEVAASTDGVTWRPLPAPLRPVPTVRDLVRDAAAGRFGVLLAAPIEARFVRLSGAGLELRVGDVQVHAE